MKTVPLKKDRWRVFMDTEEYRQLLEHAYSNKKRSVRLVRIMMRLMACSMRVVTATYIEYGQFEKRQTPVGEYWVAKIQGKDSTDREAETRPRAVFIPDDLMDEIHRYARRKNLGPEDRLFTFSKKTLQRDVYRSAGNAATATGNEEFRKVSAHDLRRYFATHLLFRQRVRPAVVRMLGGWKSDEAMYEYLVLPDDVLFTELADAGLLGTSYDKLHQRDHAEKIEATTARLGELVDEAEPDEAEAAWASMQDVFDDIDAITMGAADDSASGSTADQHPDENQFSLNQFGSDDFGSMDPAAAAKAAYLACLVLVSWSVTLAPVA